MLRRLAAGPGQDKRKVGNVKEFVVDPDLFFCIDSLTQTDSDMVTIYVQLWMV